LEHIHEKHPKYENSIHPRVFSKGDFLLVYDQDKDDLGVRKFNPLWRDRYIVRNVLEKGAYELADYEGNVFPEPRNGLYLKKYYA